MPSRADGGPFARRLPLTRRLPAAHRGAVALVAAGLVALSACTAVRDAAPSGPDAPAPDATAAAPDSSPAPAAADDGSPGAEALGGTVVPDGAPTAPTVASAAQLDVDPASDEAYSRFYEQEITWGPCEDSYLSTSRIECGTLTVPSAWNAPDGETLDLAVIRLPATGTAQGSLITNPGGPGGSGVDFVGMSGDFIGTEQLRSAYDLVSFDPRGVFRSAGFRCLTDAERDRNNTQQLPDPADPDALEQTRTTMEEYGQKCQAQAGDLLGRVDTLSVVRDMDVLRAVLGEEQLDYLGFSYGTYLGATYAETYPKRVGRMVLDAAISPRIGLDDIVAGQAQGFEESIAEFVRSCQEDVGESCPFTGSPEEGVQQLRDFFARVDADPIPTADPERSLTGPQARSAVMLLQYNQGNWRFGYTALRSAMVDGDGSGLLTLADAAVERQADGTYRGNAADALVAVNCLDHPWVTDEQFQTEEAQRLAEEYPTLGDQFGFAGTGCGAWPVQPVRTPAPITAPGTGPIVVVGTTHDPATPYRWARSLATDLENGRLITRDGYGHTAYGSSGGCVETAVDAYLIDGTAPEDGLTC